MDVKPRHGYAPYAGKSPLARVAVATVTAVMRTIPLYLEVRKGTV